jgi:hypothetical protein
MQEFTSISVSSYDAASLADKLTEKSAAGWDVVAIVPAGTNITAYLSRESEAVETAPSWDTGSDATASAAADEPVASESAAEPFGVITTPSSEASQVEESEPAWEPEPVAEAPAPVEEPAGWAVAPEPASPPPASTGVAEASPEPAPYVDTTSGYSPAPPSSGPEGEYVGEPRLGSTTAGYDSGTSTGATTEPSTGYDAGTSTTYGAGATAETGAGTSTGYDAGTTADAGTGTGTGTGYDAGATADTGTTADTGAADTGVAGSQAASSAAEQTTATTASAAPAGWYADPSGRYELRYWDGNQWTEHVSRAGQQYTDPPVA